MREDNHSKKCQTLALKRSLQHLCAGCARRVGYFWVHRNAHSKLVILQMNTACLPISICATQYFLQLSCGTHEAFLKRSCLATLTRHSCSSWTCSECNTRNCGKLGGNREKNVKFLNYLSFDRFCDWIQNILEVSVKNDRNRSKKPLKTSYRATHPLAFSKSLEERENWKITWNT